MKYTTALRYVCALVVLLIASEHYVSAQAIKHPDPCTPCKIAVQPWNTLALIRKYITIGSCTYEVTYRKRICNSDGCQELKVEKIRPFAGSCGGDSVGEIATLVLGKMVTENSMGFQPDSVGLGANGCWRIIRPACWRLDSIRCSTWPPPGGFSADTLRYNYGDILPCDTSDCCSNVIYPTRNLCGDILYDTPDPHDLPWLHFLRNSGTGADSAAFVKASEEFVGQFSPGICKSCYVAPGDGNPSPPNPQCKRQCPADLMTNYKRLINERLRRKYGP